MQAFFGTGTALVTPFKTDNSVDYVALEQLVNFQIENGVEYLVVLGTTGETTTLTSEEIELVKKKIIEVNNGRLPLVLGIGGNNTANIVNQLQTTDLSAFQAILSVSPYYNRPSQEGIFQHFLEVAKASPVPVIIYNVPSRTGANMLPETVVRLANASKNIIGVKEAAGDMIQAMKIIKSVPKDFLVLSGDDEIALPMVLAGGAGVISVIGQAYPKEFSELIRLGLKGKNKEAFELQYKLLEVIGLIFAEGNPVGIKGLLSTLGVYKNESNVRLPLVKATDALQEKMKNFIANFS
ncbi:4-hydroxy-tetrahydrodipicolinate synthase [Bacteroidota bacterium]